VGAGLAFGLGMVYCWIQTWLSYRVRDRSLYWLSGLQLLNSVMTLALLVMCILLYDQDVFMTSIVYL